ncbi:MAG: mechanosensitive ion channel family protein [Terriglobia bacterium]
MVRELAQTLHVAPSLLYAITGAALLVLAVGLGFALNRLFRRWTRKHHNTWGEYFFALLEPLPLPLLVLAALYIGLELLDLPRAYERVISKVIFALVVLILCYFPAKIVILLLRRVGQRDPALEQVARPVAVIIRVLFAVLGVIVLLENLGISLTAVWTTLGIGSVAVALALQETLSNLFAGFYILLDRPVRTGDYIKLDGGQEGFVVRIGWRSTVIRTLPNNLVIIPNSTLAKAIITNYSLPEPRMAVGIQVSVAYGTDPTAVEKILLDVTEQASRDRLEGLLTFPAPSVRLIPGFGDSSLDFSLNIHVAQFTDQYLVQSELRKRILKRFEEEGIEIPFPTRTIQIDSNALATLSKREPNS